MSGRMDDKVFESTAQTALSIAGGQKLSLKAALVLIDARQAIVDEAQRARASEAELVEALEDVAKCGLGLDLFDPWLKQKIVAALSGAKPGEET